ncbi:MAG: hypothetical protein WA418_31800 [Bradyrhizobium sp.]
MSEPSHPDPNDLTGIWDGLFKQPDTGRHVPFTATLIETGNLVTGSTHEPCILPVCPRKTHYATLSGRRAGLAVSFVKTYDPPGFGYDIVSYRGTLNGDATEIFGTWSIALLTGEFLMVRAGRKAAERVKKRLATA